MLFLCEKDLKFIYLLSYIHLKLQPHEKNYFTFPIKFLPFV